MTARYSKDGNSRIVLIHAKPHYISVHLPPHVLEQFVKHSVDSLQQEYPRRTHVGTLYGEHGFSVLWYRCPCPKEHPHDAPESVKNPKTFETASMMEEQ